MFEAVAAGQRVRWLRLSRRLKDEAARGTGRLLGLAALGVGLALVVFGAAFGGGFYVTWKQAPELLLTGTSAGLTGLAAALVFSSLGHAAQSFFQSQDLWMWDSAPTGAGARFIDRCTETAMAALPPTLALGSLALGGFALGGGLGFPGAIRAVVAVVVVVPLPLCVGVALAHIAGGLLPAGELRRISLLLLGVGVTAGLVWFRRARVERLLTEEGANQLLSAAKDTGAIGPAFLPPRLLASFVVDGDVFGFFAGAGIVAAVVLFAFGCHVFLYDRARKLAVDESPTGVLRGSDAERFWSALTSLAPRDLRPLLRKDLLSFVRDPGQWGQVVLLGGVGVLYIVNASALADGLRPLGPFGPVVLIAMHTGIVGFVAGGLAARFAFPQLGLEGPAIWIIDGAPLSPQRLLIGKWLASFPVVVFFPSVLAFGGAIVLGFSPGRVLWSTALIVTLALGIAALAVFRGAQKPLFDAASLSELAMGPGAVSTMVLATSLAFGTSVGAFAAGGLLYAAEFEFADGVVVFAVPVFLLAPLLVTAWFARRSFRAGVAALLGRRSDEVLVRRGAQRSVDALE
ncbi:MAG: hypothetical protein Q8O67_01025 [Deltaproteobacteria bacterium]|nr:hypothetical protein [Deltaproteobacteria bacterium]